MGAPQNIRAFSHEVHTAEYDVAPRGFGRLTRMAAAALLAGALAGGPASAEGRGHDHGRWAGEDGGHGRWARDDGGRGRWAREDGGHGRWGREDGGGWRGEERGGRGPPPGRWGYGPPGGYAPYGPMGFYPPRAMPPGFAIRRGGMIPPGFRGSVVPDYGRHRLRPPPPGFAWVRMGDRFMLVSRATGQIFDVIGD